MKNLKFNLIIRIVAAAYIIFLACSLISQIRAGAVTGNSLIFIVIGIVAFFSFGAWAIVSTIRTLLKQPTTTDEEEEKEKEQERLRTAASQKSLFATLDHFSDLTSGEENTGNAGNGNPTDDARAAFGDSAATGVNVAARDSKDAAWRSSDAGQNEKFPGTRDVHGKTH